MKIIFSRKGFDSSFGKVASPILEDGSMMSLPIPGYSHTRYRDIQSPGFDLQKMLPELTKGGMKGGYPAHFDPDLNSNHLNRKDGWKGSLGQTGAAQGHLQGQKVDVGDIFLFFGWFRDVQLKNEQYGFKPGSPNLHVLFGYLQVGEVLCLGSNPKEKEILSQYPWLEGHPHLHGTRDENNTLYLASDELIVHGQSLGISGSGTFDKFKPELQLTAPNQTSRSLWKMPNWLQDSADGLSYHNDPCRWTKDEQGNSLMQSVAKGQEFVHEVKNMVEFNNWLKNIVSVKPKNKPKF